MTNQDAEKPKSLENQHIIRQGRLDVGDGHELYWVDWGYKQSSQPIFYMHGGPGSGFSENDFAKFDPQKHRVIFHDQRGAGRSTPFASTEANTTQHLVSDIEALRQELGFRCLSLYGFSWGATLALLYAIAYPALVDKMLIGSIFLARQADNDFYLKGGIATHFPEAWDRFVSKVPQQYRSRPGEYYKRMLTDEDQEQRASFAREWMLYEASIGKLDYDPKRVERELKDFAHESLSYLEAHYILNDCFIPDNLILDNADKLQHIDIVILQGRYDFVCMPSAAYDLKKALSDRALLHVVMSGHAADTVLREVRLAYTNMLWPR